MALLTVTTIISGGQVGADRAGLDFAIEQSIPHGGWCPKYRIAQDGTVPFKYQLQEAEKPGYPYRTKLNVRDSDGTAVFTTDPPGRGSSMTIQACFDFGRPYVVITTNESLNEASQHLLEFIRKFGIKTLNVAGSRKPDFYQFTKLTLQLALDSGMPMSAANVIAAKTLKTGLERRAVRRKTIPDDFGEGDRRDN
jgi:hypothetical protein